MYTNPITSEQIAKMKKQEYNKRYYQKKRQEEFIKAVKLIESMWNTVICNEDVIYNLQKVKKCNEDVIYNLQKVKNLHKMIIALSVIVIILSVIILSLC